MMIRLFKKSNVPQIAQLFHDTVRTINSSDYSEAQVKAWAPDNIYFRDWEKECSNKHTFVAVEQEIVKGFAELENDGYINCIYCHKDFQGNGIGSQLIQHIEIKAKKIDLNRLYSDVSITAQPFFLKMNFTIQKQQTVHARGEIFTNYKMTKMIGDKF